MKSGSHRYRTTPPKKSSQFRHMSSPDPPTPMKITLTCPHTLSYHRPEVREGLGRVAGLLVHVSIVVVVFDVLALGYEELAGAYMDRIGGAR